MTIGTILGLGCACLLIHPIPADFKLDVPNAPAILQPSSPSQEQPGVSPRPRPIVKRPPLVLAQGFGHDVPLGFAVQQIVPRFMTVAYGDTVDRQIRVTWQGGRPWQLALQSVLQPIGLHMRVSGRKLLIAD